MAATIPHLHTVVGQRTLSSDSRRPLH